MRVLFRHAMLSLILTGLLVPAVEAQTAAGARTRARGEGGAAASLEAEVRRATERFRDVRVALAEGYIPDPSHMCITAEMEGMPRQLGAMGIHYFRPDMLGITGPPNPRVGGTGTHTDFLRPGALIYEPQPDGSLQLVAVENLVFARAWKEAGNTAAPAFNGAEYFYMHDNPETPMDEAHGFEPHYELHFWVHRDNPSGAFMPFNPKASCQHHRGGHAHGK